MTPTPAEITALLESLDAIAREQVYPPLGLPLTDWPPGSTLRLRETVREWVAGLQPEVRR